MAENEWYFFKKLIQNIVFVNLNINRWWVIEWIVCLSALLCFVEADSKLWEGKFKIKYSGKILQGGAWDNKCAYFGSLYMDVLAVGTALISCILLALEEKSLF